MAFTDSTTYAGTDALGFYSKALLPFVSKQHFTFIPNVKNKTKLASLEMGDFLVAADCSFSSAGEGTLAQKSFTVDDLKINLEYCLKTFEANYLSEQLKAGSNGEEVMPVTFESYLLDLVAKKTAQNLETAVWQGNSVIDGLHSKLSGDTDVIDVTGTTLSASNIITELTKVYDAIPNAIIDAEDLKIYISPAAARYYKQKLASTATEAYYNQKNLDMMFLGVELVVCPGMSTNRMVAARASNMFILTDLESDFEDIQIIPMKGTLGTPTVRFVGGFKFSADYMFGTEIVYYWA